MSRVYRCMFHVEHCDRLSVFWRWIGNSGDKSLHPAFTESSEDLSLIGCIEFRVQIVKQNDGIKVWPAHTDCIDLCNVQRDDEHFLLSPRKQLVCVRTIHRKAKVRTLWADVRKTHA